jgi:hypothetical protein
MTAQLKSYQQRRIADSQASKLQSIQPVLEYYKTNTKIYLFKKSQQLLTLYSPWAKVLCLLQARIQGRGRLNASPLVLVHQGVRG